MSLTIIKGTILSAPALGQLEAVPGGYLVAVDGAIQGVYPVLPEQYAGAPVEDFGDALILQSFADLHLHAPQYPMLGMGMDLPLLDWLNAYAFPTEARFADTGYAREIYRRLARELIANGTTRVCMFSSLHTDATLILMEELEKAGVTGYVGKVNMDRNAAPGVLEETTEGSMRETLRWLEASRDFRLVKPMLTPRFTPSCTDELMAFLGSLAAERDLPVQSHLSENQAEMAWVRQLHPDCQQYWETYAKYGLWNDRTVMAHCVWSDGRERRAMGDAGVTAVHCADSNQNICSGVARVLDNWETDFLTVPEGWYLGTSAGAAYFGERPGFAPGNRLHALVLADDQLPQPHPLMPQERLERAVYLRQNGAIRAVWSDGRKVFSAET